MTNKVTNLLQRWEKINKISQIDINNRWQKIKNEHIHLVSTGSIIGEYFQWNLEKIAQWALSSGFDGLEIRAQDFGSRATPTLSNIPIGIHLSDRAYWTMIWKNDQDGLREKFDTRARVREYFGYTNRQGMLQKLKAEIQIGHNLRAQYFVFHASEIDFDAILTGHTNQVRNVLSPSIELIQTLGCPELTIENAPAHEAGLHDAEDFAVFAKQICINVTIDTSHLQIFLHNSQDASISNEAKRIATIPNLNVTTIHLSESHARKITLPQTIPLGFWARRKLTHEVLVDDHSPIGIAIRDPWSIIYQSGARFIVHELKASSFDLIKKALRVQQAYLAGFEV